MLFKPKANLAPAVDQSVSPRSLHDADAEVKELAWLIKIAPEPGAGESSEVVSSVS